MPRVNPNISRDLERLRHAFTKEGVKETGQKIKGFFDRIGNALNIPKSSVAEGPCVDLNKHHIYTVSTKEVPKKTEIKNTHPQGNILAQQQLEQVRNTLQKTQEKVDVLRQSLQDAQTNYEHAIQTLEVFRPKYNAVKSENEQAERELNHYTKMFRPRRGMPQMSIKDGEKEYDQTIRARDRAQQEYKNGLEALEPLRSQQVAAQNELKTLEGQLAICRKNPKQHKEMIPALSEAVEKIRTKIENLKEQSDAIGIEKLAYREEKTKADLASIENDSFTQCDAHKLTWKDYKEAKLHFKSSRKALTKIEREYQSLEKKVSDALKLCNDREKLFYGLEMDRLAAQETYDKALQNFQKLAISSEQDESKKQ